MLDLFYVKSFVSVTQTGSFRLAAQRNNITQPAVSQHIQILEKNLNCVLLERSSKSVSLTPAGRIFLVYANKMLEAYQSAKNEIEMANKLSIGSIRIVSIYSIGLYQLKPMIHYFLKKHPNINIHLEYCDPHQIYHLVEDKNVDFAMVAFPKQVKGLTTSIITHDQLVLVQSTKYRVIKSRKTTLDKLHHAPFIGFDSTAPTGSAINEFLSRRGVSVSLVKEYNNIETIKNTVEVGMGCAILPKTTVIQELETKKLEIVSLADFDLKRPLAIVYKQNKVFSNAAKVFLDAIAKIKL